MNRSGARDNGRGFAISYYRWLEPLFTLLALGPRRSIARLASDRLEVRMGWAFRLDIPVSTIRSAYRRPNPWWNLGLGVRTNLLGTWAICGSWDNIVQVDLEPPAIGHLFWGFPVGVHHVLLSLEDPEEFLTALGLP